MRNGSFARYVSSFVCMKGTGGPINSLVVNLLQVRFLRIISHPSIIGLVDLIPPASRDFDDATLVFPLMDSDLKQLCSSGYRFTDKDMRYIVYRILTALHYLHSRGIAHRDIKSPNVLLASVMFIELVYPGSKINANEMTMYSLGLSSCAILVFREQF